MDRSHKFMRILRERIVAYQIKKSPRTRPKEICSLQNACWCLAGRKSKMQGLTVLTTSLLL